MSIIIGPLETFYIVGALVLLAIVLIAYPTLRERSKKKKK